MFNILMAVMVVAALYLVYRWVSKNVKFSVSVDKNYVSKDAKFFDIQVTTSFPKDE
jgi:hypothetical protein